MADKPPPADGFLISPPTAREFRAVRGVNQLMAKGGFFVDKIRRCLRTLFFMVAMLASLLVSSLPVLVAIGDMLVPCILISSFTCVRCYGFKEHLRRYAFKSVYSMCDGPALSNGPYLGTVCVFTVNSQLEAEASSSPSRQRLHLKKSWVAFALGHTVVAYRTSCRARRKLLLHRVDPEAALSCKSVFSGYQKVPRSPTPSGSKTPKSDSEIKWKVSGNARDESELPVRLLADIDSLFIICQGLTIHYKMSLPGSPPRSLSSAAFLEPGFSCSSPKKAMGRPVVDRHPFTVLSKNQHNIHRSYSNQFHSSSLYDPLLDGSATTSPVLCEEIPVISLDDVEEEEMSKCGLVGNLENNGQLGIVLVHGFGGGVFSWRHVMGVLARQTGCKVAAYDRPGWGLTSRLRAEDWEEKELSNPYKLEIQVELLLAFCSEMGFSSVVLVGHDDGGLLALKAAQRLQESPINSFNVSIKGVVLLSVSLSREVVPGFARILLRTSLGKKHLVRPLLRTEITQVVNRRAWYDATKLTTEVLNLYKFYYEPNSGSIHPYPLITANMKALCVEGWDEALHEIARLSYETVLSPQNAEALLKSLEEMPVLVVGGVEDALVSLKSSQVMASKLPNSRLITISGCGHLPHEECPSALLAALSPFITKILLQKPHSHTPQ
uniref:AB hydrolase-1 domain-containing protein n=1 Tax=Cucumis melo TaxID=3656 RepID=A0A9I9DT51_CUCME